MCATSTEHGQQTNQETNRHRRREAFECLQRRKSEKIRQFGKTSAAFLLLPNDSPAKAIMTTQFSFGTNTFSFVGLMTHSITLVGAENEK